MTARAGGAPYLRAHVNAHPEIKQRLLLQIGALSVWIVKGKIVRDKVFIDFTEGGNSNAYAWMPPHEIWLDTDVSPDEMKFVLLHELHEYNRMAEGLGYERAHDSANIVEGKARASEALWQPLWTAEIRTYRKKLLKSQPDLDSRRVKH